MKTIKFKGVEVGTGKVVYGDFLNGASGKLIYEHRGTLPARYVEPESVRQMVGYDKNGNEIYEGDTIIIDDKGEMTVGEILPPQYLKFGVLKGNSDYESNS